MTPPSRQAVADQPAAALPQYRPAQQRVIAAAVKLFAEHGVRDTSLQMIADSMGLAKAAVYYQFRTKDEIVLAVTNQEMAGLNEAIDVAEEAGRTIAARQALLERVVDLSIERRNAVGVLQCDPQVLRLLSDHTPFQETVDRLYATLLGEDPGPDNAVLAAMLSGAIGGALGHPRVAALDNASIRVELLRVARRLLDLPEL
jgi:AcrR family transcriptional regulator